MPINIYHTSNINQSIFMYRNNKITPIPKNERYNQLFKWFCFKCGNFSNSVTFSIESTYISIIAQLFLLSIIPPQNFNTLIVFQPSNGSCRFNLHFIPSALGGEILVV